jgi:hypothetical protein
MGLSAATEMARTASTTVKTAENEKGLLEFVQGVV